MPCYHPLKGYRARSRNPSGKYSLVFSPSQGYIDQSITVPCGGCIGCRLDYSRNWAIRCMHEAEMHMENCFITLTYNKKSLPEGGTLKKTDFQKFMKRLRKKYGPDIRYFHCGEYGEKLGRPHYHALLFNFNFSDRYLWRVQNGNNIYRSESLEKLWPFGFCEIGSVTFESAAYVARYVVKKVKGQAAKDHYQRINKETGEVIELTPEYVTMSRRPGIGRDWIDKYKNDVYPHDFVVVNDGKQWKPPRYYDQTLSDDEIFSIKARRSYGAKSPSNEFNCTTDRRLVREMVKKEQIKHLTRSLE
jgi:hypothetical protein